MDSKDLISQEELSFMVREAKEAGTTKLFSKVDSKKMINDGIMVVGGLNQETEYDEKGAYFIEINGEPAVKEGIAIINDINDIYKS